MAHMVTVSSKGQLVIPAQLRKKYRLKSGSRVLVHDKDGEIRIEPNPYDALLALRGKYARFPLEQDLVKERRKLDRRMEGPELK
jgi:AbrB family looped-hinge helix DNA binding protein